MSDVKVELQEIEGRLGLRSRSGAVPARRRSVGVGLAAGLVGALALATGGLLALALAAA